MSERLPSAVIAERLRRARRAWRVTAAGAGMLRGLAFLLLAVLVAVAADNVFALPGWLRLALGVVFVAGMAYELRDKHVTVSAPSFH